MNCTGTHSTPREAKRVVIRDYPTQPGGREIQASNGRWVRIEEAVCGTHKNTLRYDTLTIPVEALLGIESADLDYAKRVYEADVEKRRLAHEADMARYTARRQDEYDNVTYEVERDDQGVFAHRSIANWEMYSVEQDPALGTRRQHIAHVYVEAGEGRAWVHVGEYMNSGRGRGSLRYVHALMDVYKQAINEAVRWNAANGG